MNIPNGSRALGDDEVGNHLQIEDAPQAAVDFVLAADDSADGRSQWVWVRLPSGDLFLGVYPQGATYFGTEHWRTI